MIETEFDRRLRDWLDEGPGTPDPRLLASVIEHASNHRQRRSLRVAWNDATSSWRAWSPLGRTFRLVVLTAVIVVLAFLGALYAGIVLPEPLPPSPTASLSSTPVPASLATCPPGSTPESPGPTDQARPPAGSFGAAVFDRQSGRIVVTVQPGFDARPQLWSFDVCRNTWHPSSATLLPAAPPPHLRLAMGYDPRSDRTLVFTSPIMSFDVDRDLATPTDIEPLSGEWEFAYRPATHAFIAIEWTGHLWALDPAGDSWRLLPAAGDSPPSDGAKILAYDAAVDRLVLYTASDPSAFDEWYTPSPDRRTYEFDFTTMTWTRAVDGTPVIEEVWGDVDRFAVAYDEAQARTVLFGAGRLIAYDAARHAWAVVHDSPLAQALARGEWPASEMWSSDLSRRVGVSLVYDPINRRVVALGGYRGDPHWGSSTPVDDVVAFDLATQEWSQLLAPAGP